MEKKERREEVKDMMNCASPSRIANLLGCSPKTVAADVAAIKKEDPSCETWKEYKIKKSKELHQKGISLLNIARFLQVSVKTVRKYLKC